MDMIATKYQTLGASKGWEPSQFDNLVMLVSGTPSSGKTTFLCSNPDAYILDFEGRAGDMIHSQATRFHHPDFAPYLKIIEALVDDAKAGCRPCKTVCFDTVDTMVDVMIPYLSMIKNGGSDIRDMPHGKGWFLLRDTIGLLISKLFLHGYGVAMSCHLKQLPLTDGDGNVTGFKRTPYLSASITQAVHSKASIQGAMVRRTEFNKVEKTVTAKSGHEVKTKVDVEETKFYLVLKPGGEDGLAESKNPYLGHLKEVIELPEKGGWAHCRDEYNKAIETIRNGDANVS